MLDVTISRRVFIGAAVYLVTAPLLASSLQKHNALLKITQNGQFFDNHQLTILTDVAEIMIPKTDTPGAIDAYVIPVLDDLMISWANAKTKKQYTSCIDIIQSLAQDTYSQQYQHLAPSERQQLIEQLDKRAFENTKTDLSKNYRKLKEMIFHVYYTSEQANPDFVLIPGMYRGDLSLAELNKIKSGVAI